MNDKTFVITPRISEKAYGLSATGVYVFNVPTWSNKQQIMDKVTEMFSVTVTDVRVVVQNGKPKKSMRKRNAPIAGSRKKTKKAYVTLKKGDKLPFFEEIKA